MPKEKIGWTAQFTAAVWARAGVAGAKRFVTWRGRLLEWVVRWGGGFLGLRGPYSVANLFLLPRYLGINTLLEQRQPTQIIELAAGLSPRGYEWARTHARLYVEADQPNVITVRQKILAQQPSLPNYHQISVDLRQSDWVVAILPFVQLDAPTLIICEGLSGYLDEQSLTSVLHSIRGLAQHFSDAKIWLDLYLKLDRHAHGRVFWAMLPAQLLWKWGHAPMRMFLSDITQIKGLLNSNGFKVYCSWSSVELARLARITEPPFILFHLVEVVPMS